jgi:hypothetical protein
MITNDTRRTREVKSRIAHGKSSIQQQEQSLHQQTGLKFKAGTSQVL